MVFNESGERGKGEEMVLANPRIIKTGKATDVHEEQCLSFKLNNKLSVAGDVEVCRSPSWRLLPALLQAAVVQRMDRFRAAATAAQRGGAVYTVDSTGQQPQGTTPAGAVYRPAVTGHNASSVCRGRSS